MKITQLNMAYNDNGSIAVGLSLLLEPGEDPSLFAQMFQGGVTMLPTVQPGPPVSESPLEPPASSEPKPAKAKRRTKKEMVAARAAEVEDGEAHPEPKPVGRRPRKIEDEGEPYRQPSEADNAKLEIADADLSKAASDAARVITPAKVMDKLEEFGVSGVGEIKGAQRQEFLDWCVKETEVTF